ncbi:DddA-like double-stranded DNA deaminase toxin [Amycolatopsis sp. NPDC059021]|uniref:DddA-like double-stranded DNA deaminase toxin n=1 Tax=Amycolatopsis sp. NPDC059021 TaxID=3346704 RepID=UPI0036709D79
MSIDELANSVGVALEKLPTGELAHAERDLTQARDVLAAALAGATNQKACQALEGLETALQDLTRIQKNLADATEKVGTYLARIGATKPRTPSRPAQPSPPKPSPFLSPEQVKKIRAELPPPVPKPNPENRKTHGRWVDSEGNIRESVSGEDQKADEAAKLFRQAGVPMKLAITSHVEVKVATEMIQTGQRHSEIVVNNPPCVGIYGCDSMLPVLLPEGFSVTVYGPDGYQQTFAGGEQW